MLDTQGAISHSRAKTKVPMAATKRALATLGWVDLAVADRDWAVLTGVAAGWIELGSIEGLGGVTGRSVSTAAALAASGFSVRGDGGDGDGACIGRAIGVAACALAGWDFTGWVFTDGTFSAWAPG